MSDPILLQLVKYQPKWQSIKGKMMVMMISLFLYFLPLLCMIMLSVLMNMKEGRRKEYEWALQEEK